MKGEAGERRGERVEREREEGGGRREERGWGVVKSLACKRGKCRMKVIFYKAICQIFAGGF